MLSEFEVIFLGFCVCKRKFLLSVGVSDVADEEDIVGMARGAMRVM